jgi:RNA polymerase sigma-70 factor (ECF subfamily)
MRQNQLLFEELLLPHLDGAYNLARWLVGTDQDAQAVVREAYNQAWAELGEFRGTDARVWLLTIVRNTAGTWMRAHRNHSRTYSRTIQFEEASNVVLSHKPSLEPSPEERKRELPQALSRLPFELREILALRDIEGWSYGQLASALSLPRDTMISRLSEARLRLRQEMTEVQRRGYENEL